MAENELAKVALTPMTLIESATTSGASIEQMQQLFELQLRWEANEARKEYNNAMAAFKAEGMRIAKDHRVRFQTSKGLTDYKHATLGNVVEQVTPVLSKYGLSATWDVQQTAGGITVVCKVSHIQGHSETVQMTADPDDSGNKNKIQQVGSTVTYLQRYTLLSALGLATYDGDDDAAATVKKEMTITEEQEANLDALIVETGTNMQQFCTYMKVSELKDIPAKSYNYAVQALEKKRGGAK